MTSYSVPSEAGALPARPLKKAAQSAAPQRLKKPLTSSEEKRDTSGAKKRRTSGTKSGTLAAKKAAQKAPAPNCTVTQSSPQSGDDCHFVQDSAYRKPLLYKDLMGDAGLEPATPSLSSWCSNQLS